MAAPIHMPADIAAFLGDGETRLIAAAYRGRPLGADLYLLEDGTAREVRALAKRELRCMFADCPSPDLTTASRANKRDGFVHFRGGGGHAPESVNHRQGKAVVAGWLRRIYGPGSVSVEEATDTQRTNVADILLTHETGRRVAFEVQYAPLSVEAWQARHESYVRQGIIDVWLWGHTRVRKSRSSYAAGPYRLDDTQDALRQADMRVTFLNPETGQIGIAVGAWRDAICLANQREVDLAVESLTDVRMSDEGLTSRRVAQFVAVSRARADELIRTARREAEREAQYRQSLEQTRARKERETQEWVRQTQAQQARRDRMEELSRRRRELLERGADAEFTAIDGDTPPAPNAPPDSDATLTRASGVKASHCRICGKPLDPILASTGVHVGPCEWRAVATGSMQ